MGTGGRAVEGGCPEPRPPCRACTVWRTGGGRDALVGMGGEPHCPDTTRWRLAALAGGGGALCLGGASGESAARYDASHSYGVLYESTVGSVPYCGRGGPYISCVAAFTLRTDYSKA